MEEEQQNIFLNERFRTCFDVPFIFLIVFTYGAFLSAFSYDYMSMVYASFGVSVGYIIFSLFLYWLFEIYEVHMYIYKIIMLVGCIVLIDISWIVSNIPVDIPTAQI